MNRRFSRLSIRLLAFNVLLVFVPAAGMMYLGVYEEQLLRAQERSMVQQGRILAAALSNQAGDFPDQARDILIRLRQRTQSRLRVVDSKGWLLADSSLLGPRREPSEEYPPEEKSTRESWLYRVGAGIYRTWSRLFERSQSSQVPTEYYSPDNPLLGREVRDALAGRYGAVTRLIAGQRSVTLYSAIPVRKETRSSARCSSPSPRPAFSPISWKCVLRSSRSFSSRLRSPWC